MAGRRVGAKRREEKRDFTTERGMSDISADVASSLAMRDNILTSDIPHIPILIEDILEYVSLPGYEENYVKTIQTMGEFIPQRERTAVIATLTPGIEARFPVDLQKLPVEDLYMKDAYGAYTPVWESTSVFKIFGVLRKEQSGVTLEATCLLPVQDIPGSWKLMFICSKMARRKYMQYCRTARQEEILRTEWDRMKL